MSNRLEEALSRIYHPCQQGYHQSGKQYLGVNFCENLRLSQHISEIFEIQNLRSEKGIHVLPDGCNDIIVSFNRTKAQSFISPSITGPYQFSFDENQWVFGIRFLPGATYSIFRDSMEYDNQDPVDVHVILSDFNEVEERLCEAKSFADRYTIILNYLEGIVRVDDGIQKLLNYCVKRIIATGGSVTVNNLAEETQYSVRYIRQLFGIHVGHSPKNLANIVRMQRALNYLWKNPKASLGETAFNFGFADQSHMNREFKRFVNTTSGMIKKDDKWILKLNTDKSRRFNR